MLFFFFKQKTAYDMRISDWSSDVCSSDLAGVEAVVVYDHHGKRQPNPLFRRLRPGQTLVVASLPCLGGYLEAVATAKRIFAKGCAIEVLHPRRRYDPGRHPEAAVTEIGRAHV